MVARELSSVFLCVVLLASFPAFGDDGDHIIEQVDGLMHRNARSEGTLVFTSGESEPEVYRMITYTKDNNQKVIVRFLFPPPAVGNDLIMLERNVWQFDKRAGRTMRVPANQSFGGTGFSYGDVARLNLSDNYSAEIISEDEALWTIDLKAKQRDTPYFRIVMTVKKQGYIPVLGTCYAKSNRVTKAIEYSEPAEFNGTLKPSKIIVTSPFLPDEVTVFTLESELLRDYPDRIFNKRNLAARLEEQY